MSKPIVIFDNGQRAALAGTADGQLPTWDSATASWVPELPPVFAGEYFVSTTGSDTTGNGSLSAPFATIQKAVNQAAIDYTAGTAVAINVAAGSYTGNITLNRYNTFIRGVGSRPEELKATQILGTVTVNASSTSDANGRQIGIDGCFISSSSDAPAVSVTGTGFFTVVVNGCYLTTNNAGTQASAFACSNDNARSFLTSGILSVQNSAAQAAILAIAGGGHQWSDVRVQHSSNVGAGAATKAITVGGAAWLFADRFLVETRTAGYQIEVSGTWASLASAKFTFANSSLANASASGQGITCSIAPTSLALFLWNSAFNITANHVVYSAVSSLASYGLLTFLGTSTSLSGVTALPQTVRVGATVSDTLTLPNLTASLPLKLNSSNGVTAAKIAAGEIVGGGTGTAGYYLKTTDGTNVEWAIGGGGGSGTVTSVSAGTGIAITGDANVNPTVSLATLSPSPAGTVGGAATVAQVTVDAYGRVTAASGVSIEIAASQVTSGTLSITRGGTGTGTAPTLNGVIYAGSVSAYASTAAGTAGTVLKGVTDGAPAFGQVDLSTDVTGTLPEGQQEAQTLAGDLSGTTASATVIAIQSNPVQSGALAAGDAGKALVWSGSAWAAATIEASGGGGGGLTYYMNGGVAGEAPTPNGGDKQLALAFSSIDYNTGAITAPNGGNYATLAEFVTPVGQPGATTIPPGVWDFNAYLVSSHTDGVFFRAVLYKWDGTTLSPAIATSENVELTSTSATPIEYTASVYVPQTVLSATERLVVRLQITRTTVPEHTVTGYFGDGHPSHVHTAIGAPGGTGLVKVVDGVVQAPASLLVNADVKADAAIVVSKLDGNTDGGTSNKVLHGSDLANGAPTWAAVSLTADVSGTLPVANGGTGLSSAGGTANRALFTEDGTAFKTGILPLAAMAAPATAKAFAYTGASEAWAGTGIAGTNQLVGFDGSGNPAAITVGTGLSLAGGTLSAAGSGTVTSVTLDTGTTGLKLASDVTSQAITTSGTFTLSGTLAITNGGTGAITAEAARSNLSAAKTGANSDITSITGLTTALAVNQGGTGRATLTAHTVLVGDGTNQVQLVGPGTAGQVLTSNGASAAPSFQTVVTPYDVSGQAAGVPTANTVEFFVFEAVRPWTLLGTGSRARATVAPTDACSFPIYKTPSGGSATQIGSIAFTANVKAATVSITGSADVSFAVGDLLTIDVPGNVFELEGPSWTFKGTC